MIEKSVLDDRRTALGRCATADSLLRSTATRLSDEMRRVRSAHLSWKPPAPRPRRVLRSVATENAEEARARPPAAEPTRAPPAHLSPGSLLRRASLFRWLASALDRSDPLPPLIIERNEVNMEGEIKLRSPSRRVRFRRNERRYAMDTWE